MEDPIQSIALDLNADEAPNRELLQVANPVG